MLKWYVRGCLLSLNAWNIGSPIRPEILKLVCCPIAAEEPDNAQSTIHLLYKPYNAEETQSGIEGMNDLCDAFASDGCMGISDD